MRAAAVRSDATGAWSIAVLNRNARGVPVRIAFEGGNGGGAAPRGVFRKFEYDPARVPQHPFGDLPAAAARLEAKEGRLEDTLGPSTLNVYTTACDDDPPGPVRGLQVTRAAGGKTSLEWQASPEPDLCYYRVYRAAGPDFDPARAAQVGSTIATSFVDEERDDPGTAGVRSYRVVAVDRSGNAGR